MDKDWCFERVEHPFNAEKEREKRYSLEENVQQEIEKQRRENSINRMCELMLETPAVIRMLETENVGDGRMKSLIEGFHIDLDGRVTEMAKQLLSAVMYTVSVTCSKGSEQQVFVQDLAAALNRRKILRNEQVDAFIEEGYRYLQSP